MAPALSSPLPASDRELRDAFAAFTASAGRLEARYRELQAHAARVEGELRRARAEVDRLDRLAGLSELALGIAHEVKNPLNGAMGFASLLVAESDPQRMAAYAGRVVEGLRRVDGIVRELLAFARPRGAGGVHMAVGAVLEQAAREVGVAVEAVGDLQAPVEAAGLVRVFANLLRNSLEAGGAGVRVTAHVAAAAAEVCIDLRDDGPGVPADLAATVFEPFRTSKPKGMGLGLALAARLLDFLGGTIALRNPGRTGAEFRVTVPMPEARDG